MNGFGLLCGHLLGDYILQNDWQAANKVNPLCPSWPWMPDEGGGHYQSMSAEYTNKWYDARRISWMGHLACTVHCLLYTLSVLACSFWWMPWWGLVACFAAHWPIDRFRLARLWMIHVSGQKAFATGALSPWSVIVVDNTIHLLTLFGIGLIAGV